MDLNVRAFRTVQTALAQALPDDADKRKEAARRGGLAGGKSRAKSLSTQRKKEIALAGSAARWGNTSGREDGKMASQTLLPEETQQYLESHPNVDSQLQRAEKVYKIFDDFLNLTQRRVVVRESGGSTAEVDLSAPVLRTDL